MVLGGVLARLTDIHTDRPRRRAKKRRSHACAGRDGAQDARHARTRRHDSVASGAMWYRGVVHGHQMCLAIASPLGHVHTLSSTRYPTHPSCTTAKFLPESLGCHPPVTHTTPHHTIKCTHQLASSAASCNTYRAVESGGRNERACRTFDTIFSVRNLVRTVLWHCATRQCTVVRRT